MSSTEACALPWKGGENEWTRIKVEVEEEEEEEEGSPAVRLGLGIGENAPPRRVKEEGNGKLVFTPAQLHELQLQVIIYRHIEARLPVPFRLLVPIFTPVSSYSLKLPTFLGNYNKRILGSYNKLTMLEPEPGRCRRTDGKKWRCRKDVVPYEKYCERHMHRGRQRSRKPVELPKTTPPLNPTPLTTAATYPDDPKAQEWPPNLRHVGPSPGIIMTNYKSATSSSIADCNMSSVSTLTPGIANHVATSSSIVTNYMATASNVAACNRNSISIAASMSTNSSTYVANRVLSYGNKGDSLVVKRDGESPFRNIDKILSYGNKGDSLVIKRDEESPFRNIDKILSSGNKGDSSIVKRDEESPFWNVHKILSYGKRGDSLIVRRDEESPLQNINKILSYGNKGDSLIVKRDDGSPLRNTVDRSIKNENTAISIGMSPGLGCSPNSILQGSRSACTERNKQELDLGRCRRTDGKRWRCKKDVITDQKYCSQHMHRGAKRPGKSSLPCGLLCTSSASKKSTTKLESQGIADCSNLGKNLSIAVPSHELDKEDEKSRSSCSSDATISDNIFSE